MEYFYRTSSGHEDWPRRITSLSCMGLYLLEASLLYACYKQTISLQTQDLKNCQKQRMQGYKALSFYLRGLWTNIVNFRKSSLNLIDIWTMMEIACLFTSQTIVCFKFGFKI
jgi:hypothetical protein